MTIESSKAQTGENSLKVLEPIKTDNGKDSNKSISPLNAIKNNDTNAKERIAPSKTKTLETLKDSDQTLKMTQNGRSTLI